MPKINPPPTDVQRSGNFERAAFERDLHDKWGTNDLTADEIEAIGRDVQPTFIQIEQVRRDLESFMQHERQTFFNIIADLERRIVELETRYQITRDYDQQIRDLESKIWLTPPSS